MTTIIGIVVAILPTQTGMSSRGEWVRGGFVIEYGEDFPYKAAFTVMGEEKIQLLEQMSIGQKVEVTFRPESREYNERWYTDLRCLRITPLVQQY